MVSCVAGRARGAKDSAVTQTLDDMRLIAGALPPRQLAELRRVFPDAHFERLRAQGFHFYRTTFWYPLERPPENVFESVIAALRPAACPCAEVTGVEWWFSVSRTNATPQWLLRCHFDRHDLEEKDLARIRHPHQASVLFLNTVPYGELVVTDQVLTDKGARPRQPQHMRFVRPRRNLYAVFPGHLYHGVIGRMWRPARPEKLRVTMAVNWWIERPSAAYMADSRDGLRAFGLSA
jgi:hypothetical protein